MVGPEGDAGHRLVVELPGKPVAVAPAASGGASVAAAPGAASPSGNEVLAMAADVARAGAETPATPALNEPPLPPVKSVSSRARAVTS